MPSLVRQREVCIPEELVGSGLEVAATLVALGKVAEFDLEDGGLEGVEAGVPADLVRGNSGGHAVGAEGPGTGVEFAAGRGDEAASPMAARFFVG